MTGLKSPPKTNDTPRPGTGLLHAHLRGPPARQPRPGGQRVPHHRPRSRPRRPCPRCRPGPDRATGLGLHPDHQHAVALVTFPATAPDQAWTSSQHRLVQALARNTARTERQTFVVSLGTELLAVLEARRPGQPRAILHRTATQLLRTDAVPLRAGIGTPFTGITRLRDSYHAARRALRHATPERPILQAPDDLRLFDELTASRSDDAGQLVSPALRETLADPQLRQTLQAWIDHDLNVAATAKALRMHPNSGRYRLRRITQLTGHNPHHLTDLLELHSAARLLSQSPD